MRRTILILATMVVLLVVVGGVAFAKVDCEWNSASGYNCYCHPGVFCEGRDDPVDRDLIWGSTSSDRIHAYAGDDEIYGDHGALGAGGRSDIIVAGPGDDLISGGRGNNDRCDGSTGFDMADDTCEFTVRVEGIWE